MRAASRRRASSTSTSRTTAGMHQQCCVLFQIGAGTLGHERHVCLVGWLRPALMTMCGECDVTDHWQVSSPRAGRGEATL